LSFACKVAKVRGITRSTASVKVANSTMRVGCKPLIEAVGLYSTRYASHLCTRGAICPLGRSRPRLWGSRRRIRRKGRRRHRVNVWMGVVLRLGSFSSSSSFMWSASEYYRTGRASSTSQWEAPTRVNLFNCTLLLCCVMLRYAMLRHFYCFLLCISLLLGGRSRYFAVCPGFYRQSIFFSFFFTEHSCLWNSHSYLLNKL
jgi:hypothetical protein